MGRSQLFQGKKCKAKTKEGSRCKREVKEGGYCWQNIPKGVRAVASKKSKKSTKKQPSPKKMKSFPLTKLPTACLKNVFSQVDLKTLTNLRKTCKLFNVKELSSFPTLPDGSSIPLIYFMILDDVKRIVVEHAPKINKETYRSIMKNAVVSINSGNRFISLNEKQIYKMGDGFKFGEEDETISVFLPINLYKGKRFDKVLADVNKIYGRFFESIFYKDEARINYPFFGFGYKKMNYIH
jgi:hypothetical protein